MELTAQSIADAVGRWIPGDAEIVVIGNAMKRGNPEVEAVLNRKLYYASLPEVLKQTNAATAKALVDLFAARFDPSAASSSAASERRGAHVRGDS